MEAAAADAVYTGIWLDYSQSRVYGTLLTLKTAQAQALLAFFVILVGFTGSRCWVICSYFIHRTYHPRPEEHLMNIREQQVILRNSKAVGSALASLVFLMFDYRRWVRPGTGSRNWPRVWQMVLLMAFMFFHWIVFIALGTLSSQIDRGNVVRSAVTPTCGWWEPKRINETEISGTGEVNSAGALTEEQLTQRLMVEEWNLNETMTSDNYVRNCYDSASRSIFPCSKFMVKSLPHAAESTGCPFDSGYCSTGDGKAFVMDSGNTSFNQLGINWVHAKAFFVRRRNICSTLIEEPFRSTDGNSSAGSNPLYTYFQTEKTGENRTLSFPGNFSGYQVTAERVSRDGNYIPLLPLRPRGAEEKADLVFVFLRGPLLYTLKPSLDPFFLFERLRQNPISDGADTSYAMTRYLNTLACEEMVSYCSSTANYCTKWLGLQGTGSILTEDDFVRLTGHQDKGRAVKESFSFQIVNRAIEMTSIFHAVQGRGESALQASRTLSLSGVQSNLDAEQWKVELNYWFSMGLAHLQLDIFGSIQMHPGMDISISTNLLDEMKQLRQLCGRITFHSENHRSLSVLGMAVVLFSMVALTAVSLMDWVLEKLAEGMLGETISEWKSSEMLGVLRRAEFPEEATEKSGEGNK